MEIDQILNILSERKKILVFVVFEPQNTLSHCMYTQTSESELQE